MIYGLIIVIIAIIGVLMVSVVLLQSGKGGGLAGIAAGGATTQILGSRQAPDVLEKATWILASAFIVLCILSNFFVGVRETPDSVLQREAQQAPVEVPVIPPVQSPPGGGQQPAPSE